jgi:hypothetical protein
MRVVNGIRIQTGKVFWRKQEESFASLELAEKILLFIVVTWSYVTLKEIMGIFNSFYTFNTKS